MYHLRHSHAGGDDTGMFLSAASPTAEQVLQGMVIRDKNKDIRWIQRFDNFQRALNFLQEAVELSQERLLTRLEQQGLIQGFEFTHELAWKTLKDFLDYRGVGGVIGSRDAARVAFREGIVIDGELWMEMIKSRNLTSYTYREEVADEIAGKILNGYYSAFCELKKPLTGWLDDLHEG